VPECRRRDDRTHDVAVALEREERCPDGDAAQEVPRPVDRVDDPARRRPVVAFLLAENTLAATVARNPFAQCTLDGSVGVRNRAPVRLRLDTEVRRAEARERQRVGVVGEREGEGEVVGDAPTLPTGRS
jgi:hypothetical protein